MEHAGDFSAAARELYSKGYGDRIGQKSAVEQPAKIAEMKAALNGLIEKANATRFDYFQKDTYIKPLLTFKGSDKDYPIAGRGMLGVLVGHEKSGKSFVLSYIESCGIGRLNEMINFNLDLDGGRLLHFDTEQSLYFYQKTQRRILTNAKINGNSEKYDAYHLRRFSPAERVEIIEHYISNTPNISVMIIDGFVDLVVDYNSIEKVNALMQRLMQWSDQYNILIMGVLHVNKGDGKIRGHIGTEIKNKFDFIIDVKQYEAGNYRISNPTSRFAPFPESEFQRNETGEVVYTPLSEITQPIFSNFSPQQIFSPVASRDDQDVPF
jgi:roadblock/LC7 domain-containing protein